MTLIAAYGFGEGDGIVTDDVSGNGHGLTKGTLGDWAVGHGGGFAVQGALDSTQSEHGAGMYGVFPGGSPGGNPITIMFWSQIPDISTEAGYVSALNNDTWPPDPMGIAVEADGSVITWWYDSAGINSYTVPPISITPGVITNNAWAHIAVVWQPGVGAVIYVNGEEATIYGWPGGTSAFLDTWEVLLVGSSRWGSGGAIVDDLRIYDEALSQGLITTLMSEAVGRVNGINIADRSVTNVYLGDTVVTHIYQGDVLLYGDT